MAALISIIIILACILLVVVVFIQNPKGGGLTNDFGTQQLGGVQRANNFVEKATWVLSVSIVVFSLFLTYFIQPVNTVIEEEVAPGTEQNQGGQQGNQGGNQNKTTLPK